MVLQLLPTLNSLKLVEVKLEVVDASGFGQLPQTFLHVPEEFLLLLEVLCFFLLDLNLDHGLELAHELFC